VSSSIYDAIDVCVQCSFLGRSQYLPDRWLESRINVLYELGLAHALRKPVVLVSSLLDSRPGFSLAAGEAESELARYATVLTRGDLSELQNSSARSSGRPTAA
jgi:hypothetical protein